MSSKADRYERILEPLYRLAREGKTEGEREAAKRRIDAIQSRIRREVLNEIQRKLDEREDEERRQEEKRKEDERIREEAKKRFERERQELLRQKEELKWKKRAERKQKECIKREERLAMRANWINSMLHGNK